MATNYRELSTKLKIVERDREAALALDREIVEYLAETGASVNDTAFHFQTYPNKIYRALRRARNGELD